MGLTSRVVSDDVSAELVVEEDEQREGHRQEPPGRPERVEAEEGGHAGRVAEDDGQHRLEDQGEVEHPVRHALLHDGVAARLADDEVGPLHHHDRHEEGRVARVLQLLARLVRLENQLSNI